MSQRTLLIAGLLIAIFAPRAATCQEAFSSHPPPSDPSAFLSDTGAEAQRGVYLFYTQSFIDKQNERVAYRGSLYGVLRDVKLAGCDLEAKIQIVDSFSGTVKDRPTGQLQDETDYAVAFRMTREAAAGMTMLRARPSQLSSGRHTQCEEDRMCAFDWVRFQSPRRAIRETVIINGAIAFSGSVERVLAPVSSTEAGNRLIHDLQALTASRCP